MTSIRFAADAWSRRLPGFDRVMLAVVILLLLLAGGVSSVPAAIAVFALARPPVVLAYLGFALFGAITAGLAFGLVH